MPCLPQSLRLSTLPGPCWKKWFPNHYPLPRSQVSGSLIRCIGPGALSPPLQNMFRLGLSVLMLSTLSSMAGDIYVGRGLRYDARRFSRFGKKKLFRHRRCRSDCPSFREYLHNLIVFDCEWHCLFVCFPVYMMRNFAARFYLVKHDLAFNSTANKIPLIDSS